MIMGMMTGNDFEAESIRNAFFLSFSYGESTKDFSK